jgi:hypothetical protein
MTPDDLDQFVIKAQAGDRDAFRELVLATQGELVAHWTPDQKDRANDLTKIVQQAYHEQTSMLSLCLYADESKNADECVGFYTREAAPLLRPMLEIEE